MKRVAILGGGVTGLAAALKLSEMPGIEVHVVEREAEVGGLCRSFQYEDFILDYGPHKFYTLIDGIFDELKAVLGDELLEKDKRQSLFLKGRYFSFPLKLTEMVTRFPMSDSVASVSSFGLQTLKNLMASSDPRTYEDFLISKFGTKLYRTVFEPMAKKMFGNPTELDRKLAEVRISSPGLVSVLKDALLGKKVDRTISAPSFLYPSRGFGRIPQRMYEMARKKGAQFHLGSEVKSITVENGKARRVTFTDNSGLLQSMDCDYVLYTLPLNLLDSLIAQGLPAEIRQSTRFVNFRHTIIYYFLVRSETLLPSMWVFFPEAKFRFGRMSEMRHFSEATCPKGFTSLMLDFTCENDAPEWGWDDEKLKTELLQQMKPLGLFKENQIHAAFSKRFRNFYPIYAVGYQKHLEAVRRCEQLFSNILFLGRVGDFNYNNSDQCMDMGFQAAKYIQDENEQHWQTIRSQRFERYKIVD